MSLTQLFSFQHALLSWLEGCWEKFWDLSKETIWSSKIKLFYRENPSMWSHSTTPVLCVLSLWAVPSLSLSNYACMSPWFSAVIAKDLLSSFGYNLLFYFSLQVVVFFGFFFQPQRKPKLGKAGLLSLFSNSPEGKSCYQSHKKMILFFSCSKENPSP